MNKHKYYALGLLDVNNKKVYDGAIIEFEEEVLDKDYDGRIIGKRTNKNKMTVFFNKEDLCWYASDNHDTRFLKGIKNFKII